MEQLQIRQERIKNSWTQEYVAIRIGITKAAYSNIENGQRKPSYTLLVKLENLFKLTHRQLFKAIDTTNNNNLTEI